MFRPVDRVILAFITIASIVGTARARGNPAVGWALLAYALVVVLVWLVNRPGLGPLGSALAEIYPLFILLALYGSLDLLAGHGGVATHDVEVQGWEAALFGEQVSREWWHRSPSRFWSTLFHAVYFSYYLVIPAGPLYFLWKRDRTSLRRTIFAEVMAFAVCYVVFLIYPVAGPYYEFPHPGDGFLDNGPARLVYGLLADGSAYGAAFPSSHVAGMLTAAVVSGMEAPLLGWLLGVPALLLTAGVVYTQMHYGVDSLAGVVVAAFVILVVARNRIWRVASSE